MAVGAIGDLRLAGRVAVLHGGGAALEIGGDAAGAPSSAGNCAAVIAAIDRYLTGDIAHDAAGVVAVGGDAPRIDAAGDGLRCRAISAGHIAYDAAHVLAACYLHIAAAVLDTALRAIKPSDNTACAVAAAAAAGKGDGSLHGQIFNNAAGHIAKETAVLRSGAGNL